MHISVSFDGRQPQERRLVQQLLDEPLPNLADERKPPVRSPFPFNVVEAALGALLNGLEFLVRSAVCAVIKPRGRR